MQIKLPAERLGKEITEPPTGFPHFFKKLQPRIVTADVWDFLETSVKTSPKLSKNQKHQSVAFIQQAFEFFEAAQNPRMGSRPLLYYYSFLNLAKVAVLLGGTTIPPVVKHGISDPRENIRQRLRLPGQGVRIDKCAHDHSVIFPEFVSFLGGEVMTPHVIKVLDLFRQIPGTHRITYCRVMGCDPCCAPIKLFRFFKVGRNVFLQMGLDRKDDDVTITLPQLRASSSFRKLFAEVHVPPEHWSDRNIIWFESDLFEGKTQTVNSALRALGKAIKPLGFSSILTAMGYRHYVLCVPKTKLLPPLAVIYAVMFYFGSITRYKPYDFDRIVEDKYSWLVSEFLKTQPNQFLHGLAGHIAGVDVVQPFAYLH